MVCASSHELLPSRPKHPHTVRSIHPDADWLQCQQHCTHAKTHGTSNELPLAAALYMYQLCVCWKQQPVPVPANQALLPPCAYTAELGGHALSSTIVGGEYGPTCILFARLLCIPRHLIASATCEDAQLQNLYIIWFSHIHQVICS